MEFPTALDFLDSLGLEPIAVEPSMAYSRYIKRSEDGLHELVFSFSAVDESFQTSLKFRDIEIFSISSEMVKAIEIISDDAGPFVRIVFEIGEALSEASIKFTPALHCKWRLLRK